MKHDILYLWIFLLQGKLYVMYKWAVLSFNIISLPKKKNPDVPNPHTAACIPMIFFSCLWIYAHQLFPKGLHCHIIVCCIVRCCPAKLDGQLSEPSSI